MESRAVWIADGERTLDIIIRRLSLGEVKNAFSLL